MKFLGQSFQRLEPEENRQTDATERITTPHSRVVIITMVNAPEWRLSDSSRFLASHSACWASIFNVTVALQTLLSRQTFPWTIVRTCVRAYVGLSSALWKTVDPIRMPFGIVGRTGPGMRHVVGFGDRSAGRGTFGRWGRIWGAPL